MLFTESVQFFLLSIGGSFLFHLLWENAQAPLYGGYESFSQHFPLCLRATATGDLFMMLLLYLVLALVHREGFWIEKKEVFSHPATWILPPFLGMLLATIIELRALVDHRWSYTDAMPILPFFPVGLTPVLQMAVVPLITLALLRWMHARSHAASQPPST